jgi:hypothetical protein
MCRRFCFTRGHRREYTTPGIEENSGVDQAAVNSNVWRRVCLPFPRSMEMSNIRRLEAVKEWHEISIARYFYLFYLNLLNAK